MDIPQFHRALYDYRAIQPDDLSISTGEICYVLVTREDGWCQGLNDKGESETLAATAAFETPCRLEMQLFNAIDARLPQGFSPPRNVSVAWRVVGCVYAHAQYIGHIGFFPSSYVDKIADQDSVGLPVVSYATPCANQAPALLPPHPPPPLYYIN